MSVVVCWQERECSLPLKQRCPVYQSSCPTEIRRQRFFNQVVLGYVDKGLGAIVEEYAMVIGPRWLELIQSTAVTPDYQRYAREHGERLIPCLVGLTRILGQAMRLEARCLGEVPEEGDTASLHWSVLPQWEVAYSVTTWQQAIWSFLQQRHLRGITAEQLELVADELLKASDLMYCLLYRAYEDATYATYKEPSVPTYEGG